MFKIVLLFYFLLAVCFICCKKELSCENCLDNNKAPIAIAGPDKNITLPVDSVFVDGSASHDIDGKIVKWLWTKISGPGAFKIENQSKAKTLIHDLRIGVYLFQLTITDDKGLSAKDTIQISILSGMQANKPPIANAGVDQTIFLPTTTVNIDGSNSIDPDNNITLFSWTKVLGPSSFAISNTNAIQIQVMNLVQGIYLFELKVMDAGGLFSMDTMQVTVNPEAITQSVCDNSYRPLVNARLIPLFEFSHPSPGNYMGVAMAGNKLVFAGGNCTCINDNILSRVDIYDLTTKSWSIARLSFARKLIATIAIGNKIFFAGGETLDGPTDVVDIYDASSNTWAVAHLCSARRSLVSATVGNKVLFAGGGDDGINSIPGFYRSKQVDIYDLSTDTWSTASLSDYKIYGHTAVTVNGKVYIAGGVTVRRNPNTNYEEFYSSAKVDVYDNASNSWSVISMKEGKFNFAGISLSGNIYWAGGTTGTAPSLNASCLVEIWNETNGTSLVEHLFEPSELGSPIVLNNKIVFFKSSGNTFSKFNIYDPSTNSWSIGVLQANLSRDSYSFTVGNTIYFAGGIINGVSNQLWRLEF